MRRARPLSLACVLVASMATAALAKPRVAVLGLEVTGAVDQAATTVARDLTEGLRARAKAGDGPYSLAPNSERELIDEKLIKMCDDEAAACMTEIGRDIGADVLVYGSLAKAGATYKVSLHVLDVKKQDVTDDVTVSVAATATAADLRAAATTAYGDLVGVARPVVPGTLEIRSTAPGARVFVDDEAKDALTGGRTTLALPEGRYRVAVEAPGFRRQEHTVQVTAGANVAEVFDLASAGGGGEEGGGIGVWKPVFGVTLIATIGLAAYSSYAYVQMKSAADAFDGTRPGGAGGDITESDCDNVGAIMQAPGPDHLQDACDRQRIHQITAIAAIGGAVVTGVVGYLAFGRSDDGRDTTTAAVRRRRAPTVVVAPTVSPQGAGATLHVRW